MMSCAEMAAKLELSALAVKRGLEVPTETFMAEVKAQAHEVMGTYNYGWTQLADSTQDDRVRQGFPRNEPLLRTGALADSIDHKAAPAPFGAEGLVYSNDKVALWQEMGTERIPARSFLYGALVHAIPQMHVLFGAFAVKCLTLG